MAKPPGRKILGAASLRGIRGGGLELMKGFAKSWGGPWVATFTVGEAQPHRAGTSVGGNRGGRPGFVERLGEVMEGAMDADFYGGDAAADQAGDFVVAKFLEA